jgi:hypothetical protein
MWAGLSTVTVRRSLEAVISATDYMGSPVFLIKKGLFVSCLVHNRCLLEVWRA